MLPNPKFNKFRQTFHTSKAIIRKTFRISLRNNFRLFRLRNIRIPICYRSSEKNNFSRTLGRKRGFKCVLYAFAIYIYSKQQQNSSFIKNVGRHKNRFFVAVFRPEGEKLFWRCNFVMKTWANFCGFILFTGFCCCFFAVKKEFFADSF